jgi:hypothetical protein
MFIYLVKNNINTAKESMQALLDAGRHIDVEENAKITELMFNSVSFSHHQTERLRRMLTK